MPADNAGEPDGFLLTAVNGSCTIKVAGDLYNGASASPFWFTIDGLLSVAGDSALAGAEVWEHNRSACHADPGRSGKSSG